MRPQTSPQTLQLSILPIRLLLPILALLLSMTPAAVIYAAPITQTQTSPTYAGTVNTNANIRNGPGLQYEVVDQAQNGEAVTVVACNADCTWYKLDNGNWIAAFLVNLGDQNGTVETQSEAQSSPDSNTNGRTRSRTLDPDELVLDEPSPAALEIVTQILSYTGLPQSFEVYSANIYNAAALMVNGDRVILYDPQLIVDIENIANHDWPAVSILAHEIGHHLAGHTLSEVYNRDYELEADYFSGFILQKMGATLAEAQTVMSLLRDHPNMTDHPPQAERLAMIEAGWREAARQQSAVFEPSFSSFTDPNQVDPSLSGADSTAEVANEWVGILAQIRHEQLARVEAQTILALQDWSSGLRALAELSARELVPE